VWDFDWPAEAILPAMSVSELLNVTKVYSHAATLGRTPRIVITRPFRAPRHTITHIALGRCDCRFSHFLPICHKNESRRYD
jgi:hypothetical protein